MANSFTTNTGIDSDYSIPGEQVIGSFDSTGASDSITAAGGSLVDISVDFDTNSFVGTIDLQRSTLTGASNVAEWQTIESYTSSVEKVAQSASPRSYRLNCTVATSGSAEIELTAGARS